MANNPKVSDSDLERMFAEDPQIMYREEARTEWTDSPTFQQVVAKRMSRRDVMQGTLATAVAGFFGAAGMNALAQPPRVQPHGGLPPGLQGRPTSPLLGFEAVPPSLADTIVVPPGYSYQVILPWGTPITGTYPPFSIDNTAEEQAMQMGMHHDGMHFFPLDGSGSYAPEHTPPGLAQQGNASEHPLNRSRSVDGLLVMNHEYIEPRLLHAAMAGTAAGTFSVRFDENFRRYPDEVRKEMASHGVSITRIRKNAGGLWDMVPDARNRRITAMTPMEISGPLRGHETMVTRFSPDGTMTRGTFNNCAHGYTPWGTYLTCEENWWFYFRNGDADRPDSQRRYGIGTFSSFWWWDVASDNADETVRFNAAKSGETAADDYRNEPHCHGWVVEIDPFDPDSTPVKRTHLGRFSHEGAVFGPVSPGRPLVVYMGDDTTNGYIYKFVSADNYLPNSDGSILDHGTLYVARYNEDGTGDWIALVPGQGGLTPENGWPDQASILLNARGAGDVVGATPMDRPEWGAVDPITGQVYFTLTNNSGRSEANPANPRTNNVYGHIVRWREDNDDHTSATFTWEIFVLAGDQDNGRDLNGNALTVDNIFGSPDGLWGDPDGRLWIQTDATDNAISTPQYADIGNNQMLVADTNTGEIRRFLTGPRGQEITGCIMTPDQRTLFINVQHPGGGLTSSAAFAEGNHASNWPDGGNSVPRSATVVIWKDDGGKVGT